MLFDFADIESWDPDGIHYPDTDDSCPWCQPWCDANPGACPDPPISCTHSHSLVCDLKGRAFWWMAARLAGWEGPDSVPSSATDSSRVRATVVYNGPIGDHRIQYSISSRMVFERSPRRNGFWRNTASRWVRRTRTSSPGCSPRHR